jgi:outer membrane protein with glycine zipper
VGAASGAAAGAAAGALVGGPVGGVVGAAVGAVAGGLVGHEVAAAIDPAKEDGYWRSNYRSRPYVKSGAPYFEYRDAYRYGWETRAAKPGVKYDDLVPDLERGWGRAKAGSSLAWADAKEAVHDAWDRLEHALPGDTDKH